MTRYQPLQSNKNIHYLKFRPSLIQGLMEKHGSDVPCPVHVLLPKGLKEQHLEFVPGTGKKIKCQRKCVMCRK
jgi:hypothetical protein